MFDIMILQELLHEKEALRKQLEEQMLQISALKNQLDEKRHFTGPIEDGEAASLQRQLQRQADMVEERDKQVLSDNSLYEILYQLLLLSVTTIFSLKFFINLLRPNVILQLIKKKRF